MLDFNVGLSFLMAFLITYFALPKVIFFTQKFRLNDNAGHRSSHSGSIPILGGIGIFSGFLLSLLFFANFYNIQFIVAACVIVFFVGIVDDLLSLSPLKKLIGQIVAILIVIYLGDIQIDNMHGVLNVYELADFIATLFTVFVVVVITNGFNLIDGVDGLAAGNGIIAATVFGIIAVLMQQEDMAIISFSLVGSLFAFLKYNFNPAKIFMGDTGSLVVGMILSVLAINLIKSGLIIEDVKLPNKGPLIAIALLAIPLFDSLRVFIFRVLKGRHPLRPGRGHIHHALLDLGFSHKQTALLLYFVSLFLIVFTWLLIRMNINLAIILLSLVSYIILLLPFYILRNKK